MKSSKPVRLTPGRLNWLRIVYERLRIKNPYVDKDRLICYTCDRPIEVGELYVSSRRSGNIRHAKFRHYECARKVGVV